MNNIFNRVSKWNSQRYDRTFNLDLTCRLLKEEYTEYLESDQEVHQLDGLCDTIYVALGGLWKLDLRDEVMNADAQEATEMVKALIGANVVMPAFFIPTFIDAVYTDADFPESLAMHCIINLALIQMQAMGLTLEQCYEALNVVCDSNDSKSIPQDKVDPTVKANQDKGAYFTPPEPRLETILNARHTGGAS